MIKEMDKNWAIKNWDNLIKNYSNSNFYQSYSNSLIRKFKNNQTKFYILFDEFEISRVFAMIVIEKDVVSIPFGPVLDPDIKESHFIEFLEFIKNEYKMPLEFSIDSVFKDKFNILENTSKEIWDFSTILLELDDIELLKKNFSENRRRIVKKTLINLKDAIITDDVSNAKQFYNIYCERLAQTNGVVDFSFDELEHMLKVPNVKLHLCKRGIDDLAGIITFKFNDILINRYNCTNPKFLSLNPNSYLDYELIKKASKNHELKYYDFSGYVEGDSLDPKTTNLNRYKLSYGPKKIKTYKWYEL